MAAMLLCPIVPAAPYEWVDGMAPTVRADDPAGGGDDATLAMTTLAVAALPVEALAVGAARRRRRGRIMAGMLMAAVTAAWVARTIRGRARRDGSSGQPDDLPDPLHRCWRRRAADGGADRADDPRLRRQRRHGAARAPAPIRSRLTRCCEAPSQWR